MTWAILDLPTATLVRVPNPFRCDELQVICDSEEVSRRIVMAKVKQESLQSN